AAAEGNAMAGADLYRVKATDEGYRLVPVAVQKSFVGEEPVQIQVDLESGATFEAKAERHYFAAGQAVALAYPRTWFESETETVPISEATLTMGQSTVRTDVEGHFEATSAPRLNGFKGTRVN